MKITIEHGETKIVVEHADFAIPGTGYNMSEYSSKTASVANAINTIITHAGAEFAKAIEKTKN